MEELKTNINYADFSQNGEHRYRLTRIWDISKPFVLCIGLNPSTANGEKNDPTINILIKMFTKLGYGGFYMMNCYSYISPYPKDLIPSYSGEADMYNMQLLIATAGWCNDIVFAWGGFKLLKEYGKSKEIIKMFPNAKCFGKNADGSPIHPLAMQQRNGRDPNNPNLIPF